MSVRTSSVAEVLERSWRRCILKKMVGWERRIQETLTEKKTSSALENFRIEIQFKSITRWWVNGLQFY